MTLTEKLNNQESNSKKNHKFAKNLVRPRVNFSLKKEVFFFTIGSLVGGVSMFIPRIFMDLTIGTQYYVAWLVFARILNSNSYEVGIVLHFVVATVIGIITGIILHKGTKLKISKLSIGFIYGIIAGVVVFAVFFIPVQQFLLAPNMAEILAELDPSMTVIEASDVLKENFTFTLIDSLFTHLIWGITVGVVASLMTRKLGANYRCHRCDIEFSKIRTYEQHVKYVHETPSPSMKKILILGGGYAGVQVLRQLQSTFENDVDVSLSIVSQDNFFLHTPMLPEMATGMVEPRHIATPIRAFCKRARFFQAKVDSIDLKEKKVTITRNLDKIKKELGYDHLVIAVGGKTNFFGNVNLEKHSLTIKTLGDAIGIRNHVISMLENADQEEQPALQSKLMTFVVVGGGFSGVETIGELNDFVKESSERFYRNIDPRNIRIILVSAGEKILPEIGDLGNHAMESLRKNGVEIITNTKVTDAGEDFVTLNNGETIQCGTMIWAGGVTVDPVISKLETQHDKGGRIIVDKYLKLTNHPNVFALGDCASIIDERTGKPYPPTAQHAVREAQTVSKNITLIINGNEKSQKPFVYDSKGSMAKIGKRNGVALLMGHKFRGLFAWFVWRQYYLTTLPKTEKKIRVALDWFVDLFFPIDITRLSSMKEKSFNL